MAHHVDPFAPSVQNAHDWLRTIADSLGTDDLCFAYRATRAWMHTVRDRIGVANSAHLAAQLPEMLRGTYYEGWVPSHVPVRHDLASFVEQFSSTAGIGRPETGTVAGSVTIALTDLFSPGQLDRVFAVLPAQLCDVMRGATPNLDRPAGRTPVNGDRLTSVESRITALGEAMAVLARGMERIPVGDTDKGRMADAAQQAHRLLLSEGLAGPSSRGS